MPNKQFPSRSLPSFQPNGTIYLCANTGLDYNNSIWTHDFAHTTEDENVGWLETLFAWVKAHAVTKGYWHTTYVSPDKGYFDIGRTYIKDRSLVEESGIAKASNVDFQSNYQAYYEEALQDIDYIVFVNGEGKMTAQTHYAFCTKIESINKNVTRVHFEIDAIMTYQQSFYLGHCSIERELVYEEREALYGKPNKKFFDDDLVTYQQEISENAVSILEFDNQESLVFASDVDLKKISDDAAGLTMDIFSLESFLQMYQKIYNPPQSQYFKTNVKVSDSKSYELNVKSSPTLFVFNTTKQIGLQKLANLNGLDHILDSYAVPTKLLNAKIQAEQNTVDSQTNETSFTDRGITFEKNIANYFNVTNIKKLVKIPKMIDGWQPLNLKLFSKNYQYFIITDGTSSATLSFDDLDNRFSDDSNIIQFNLFVNLSLMKNLASTVNVENSVSNLNEDSPFLFTICKDRYSLLPSQTRDALKDSQVQQDFSKGFVKTIGNLAMNDIKVDDKLLTPITNEMTNLSISQKSAPKGTGQTKLTNMINQSKGKKGLAIIWRHLDVESMKKIDKFFSMYGYYFTYLYKYPNINTHRHFNYVKLRTVNIKGTKSAYSRHGSMLNLTMKNQVIDRLKNGVTFWNLREKLGQAYHKDYKSMPKNVLNRAFIGKYDDNILKENYSFVGGYRSGEYNEYGNDID